eukprot:s3808_g4.t1
MMTEFTSACDGLYGDRPCWPVIPFRDRLTEIFGEGGWLSCRYVTGREHMLPERCGCVELDSREESKFESMLGAWFASRLLLWTSATSRLNNGIDPVSANWG